jgi:hypothetical protein
VGQNKLAGGDLNAEKSTWQILDDFAFELNHFLAFVYGM